MLLYFVNFDLSNQTKSLPALPRLDRYDTEQRTQHTSLFGNKLNFHIPKVPNLTTSEDLCDTLRSSSFCCLTVSHSESIFFDERRECVFHDDVTVHNKETIVHFVPGTDHIPLCTQSETTNSITRISLYITPLQRSSSKMAPNRKNVTCLVLPVNSSELQNLRTTVQAKFLPLTDPLEQQQHDQSQQQEQNRREQESDSYWNWTAEGDTNTEEEADLFSLSRIESNLIADATKYADNTVHQVVAHDDYWAGSSVTGDDNESSTRKSQHEAAHYWDWSANPEAYERDRAARLTSTAHIEANLQSLVRSESVHVHTQKEHHDSYWQWDSDDIPTHVLDPSHPNHDYWTWKVDGVPSTEEARKQKAIQAILRYEAARQLVCTDRIVESLQEISQIHDLSSSSATDVDSDSYWRWSESCSDSNLVDCAAAPAVTTAGKGYWDW
jgi:hypothetical protein